MLQIYNVQTSWVHIEVQNRKFKKNNKKTSNNDRSKLKRNFFIQSINENSEKPKKKKQVVCYRSIYVISMVYNFWCIIDGECDE